MDAREATIRQILQDINAIADIANVRKRYAHMRRLLNVVLRILTADAAGTFAGNYPMIVFICQKYRLPTPVCNTLRVHCQNAQKISESRLTAAFTTDVATLRALCQLALGGSVDDIMPHDPGKANEHEAESTTHLRVSVVQVPPMGLWEVMRADDAEPLKVDASAFDYLAGMVGKGTQLNLVRPDIDSEGVAHPWLMVLEPDYLVDVTSIAGCFTPTTDSADLGIINRLKARTVSKHIHLGNMAGQILDESLTNMREGLPPNATPYKESAKAFFANNALSLAASTDISADWHAEAQMQQQNIAEMLIALRDKDPNFDVMRTMTEPSFVSETLGVQGRMDLLQSDFALLVEQKSGKKDWQGGHKEEHYVQMVIYQLMLSLQFGVDTNHASQYLMYSKYPAAQGLIREGAMPSDLIHKIFTIRNGIVFNEMRYANAELLRHDLLTWSPTRFRTKRVSDKLWDEYTLPDLSAIFTPIQTADEVSQEYFFEMLAFVQRESVVARIGNSRKEGSGFAALWNTPASDRRHIGNLLDGLTIAALRADEIRNDEEVNTERVDIVTLRMPEESEADSECMPNFRVGDVAVFYDYEPDNEPDVRMAIECRATIVGMTANSVTLKLRSPQCRTFFANKINHRWAVEHDLLDSQSKNLGLQLMDLLRTDKSRRDLLLGLRQTEVDTNEPELKGSYGEQDELVRRFMAARELFILVGPPGTGKTSRGLVAMLQETLAHDGQQVLLMAYTNRAVDEICSKLNQHGIDFLRIGSRFACAEAYRDRLIGRQKFANTKEILSRVAETRVFVGTTASVSSNSALLSIKHFDVAIIDEASQILEPNIVGLLSARTDAKLTGKVRNSIGKFVLIGDHKQLPAVVSQRRSESQLHSVSLRAIGLEDCRESFFQRMLRIYGTSSPVVYTLTRQGRMHAETAAFCNHFFYGDTLSTVPLPHQEGPLCLQPSPDADELERRLATERVIFIDSQSDNAEATDGKANVKEAELIANMIRTVVALRRANGLEVDADKTIGVVVPYRNQIAAIRKVLSRLSAEHEDSADDVELYQQLTIDTVERLQGSERDVIIYGFTVSRLHQLDFLTDSQFLDSDGAVVDRKLNVALSRAREQMVVVADRGTVSQVPLYRDMIEFFSSSCEIPLHRTVVN